MARTMYACVALCVAVWTLQSSANDNVLDLQQGWGVDLERRWFESTQGSRLVPLRWLLALEDAASTDRFLSDQNITRLGYIPYDLEYGEEPLRLPRGFVIDRQDDSNFSFTKLRWKSGQRNDEEWVGLTCAACHTGQIRYANRVMTVIGGPGGADFQGFLESFQAALTAAITVADKFDRFAAAVLREENTPENRQKLVAAADSLRVFHATSAALNRTTVVYGPGRVDAVGHILNKVAQISGAPVPKANPASAPVSYPFLWNVPQHDRVQWNGMVENEKAPGLGGGGLDYGALGRNTGEVIGVFADIKPVPNPGKLTGYVTSINVKNLDGLEQGLKTLLPPKWPKLLGDVDAARVAQGQKLFAEKGCDDCHVLLDREDLNTPIVANMARISRSERRATADSPATIATDPMMACNTYQFRSSSGVMQGTSRLFGERSLAEEDYLSEMLGIAVERALLARKPEIAGQAFKGVFGVRTLPEPAVPRHGWKLAIKGIFRTIEAEDRRIEDCYRQSKNVETLAYKARPLTGIWATAPYLHNGSVPTLFDLLLEPDKRPKTFRVGTEEFDPVKVGFVTAPRTDNDFTFDVSVRGNSNQGHEYGVGRLTDIERMALVEYMKTL